MFFVFVRLAWKRRECKREKTSFDFSSLKFFFFLLHKKNEKQHFVCLSRLPTSHPPAHLMFSFVSPDRHRNNLSRCCVSHINKQTNKVGKMALCFFFCSLSLIFFVTKKKKKKKLFKKQSTRSASTPLLPSSPPRTARRTQRRSRRPRRPPRPSGSPSPRPGRGRPPCCRRRC